ncbi:MAG: hypothetical protein ACRCVJ_16485 [Clostridium sp.]|uniref:hypothetical protein n=1 Tax=Clostridium sp. TaxID=1506 RepID=UPI003F4137EC
MANIVEITRKLSSRDMNLFYTDNKSNEVIIQCNKHKHHIYKIKKSTIKNKEWNGCMYCNKFKIHKKDAIMAIHKYCSDYKFKFIRVVDIKCRDVKFEIESILGKKYIITYHKLHKRIIDNPIYKSAKYSIDYIEKLANDNNLKVLELDKVNIYDIKANSTKFKTICLTCGRVYYKTITRMKNNCGCYDCKKNAISMDKQWDIITNICKDENLEIISKRKDFNDKYYKIKFKCKDHNKIFRVTSYRFINKNSRCPLCKQSVGESIISNYLDSVNVKFETQKIYDGLLGVGGFSLRYDFYIPHINLLIEFQGKQHYSRFSWESNDDALNKRREHDLRKKSYAIKNNINFLEIIYNQDILKVLKEELEKWDKLLK